MASAAPSPTLASLEAFVLAPDAAARAVVLGSLVEGSEAWYELHIAAKLRGSDLAGAEELVKRYAKAFPGQESRVLLMRLDFLQAGALPADSSEQREALEALARKWLSLRFDHAQAAVRRPLASGAATETHAPSVLGADVLPSTQVVLERLYGGDSSLLSQLPPCCFQDLDLERLSSADHFQRFLKSHRAMLPLLAGKPSFLNKVTAVVQEAITRRGGTDAAPKDLLDLLLLSQLEELGRRIPALRSDSGYVQALMARRFHSVEDEDLLTRESKRKRILEKIDFVSTFAGTAEGAKSGGPLQQLRSQLYLKVLQLNTELNDLHREHLVAFLEQARVGPRVSVMGNGAVRMHLRAFILDDGFAAQLRSLLEGLANETELGRFRDEVALLSGAPLGHTEVDAKWVQELTKRASVQILPHNKERFEPEEEVRLALRLKNVPRLSVQIFEINAESYYLHHKRAFESDIVLDGIGASFEVEHDYAQPPILEHDEELAFPQLTGKVGLFVLDVVGAGLRSRAVIKKGTLSLIHKCSPVGHVAYVLGPDREVVKTGARLHLDGHWFESDAAAGGRIIIPFGKRSSVSKVVFCAQGIAQLAEFERQREEYSLRSAFCLIKESVVMGQQASLIVRPRLLCCGRSCDLKLATKLEVTVSMGSGQEGVPTVRTFSNFNLASGDLRVQFLVPPRLQTIAATLTLEVYNNSTKETDVLNSSDNWTVEDHGSSLNWLELYLARSAQGYEVRCMDKAGHPQPGMDCGVSLDALLPANANLATDEQGAIHLGPLPDVTKITVKAAGLQRSWQLPPESGIQYPASLDILEREEIRLPCRSPTVSVVELGGSDNPIALRNELVEVEAAGSSDYCTLKVRGLEQGRFHLLILGEAPIVLRVHRGKRWQDDYVLRSDAILESPERPAILAVSQATARPDGIAAVLTGCSRGAKLHAVGLRFLPSNLLELVKALQDASREAFSARTFPFQRWQNMFQSDVALGDELSYVLRRRKAPAQVGNLMKRPTLLLQPREVRDTTFNREVLQGPKSLLREAERMERQSLAMSCGSARQRMERCEVRACALQQQERRKLSDRIITMNQAHIQGFQNFLKTDAFVALNVAVPPAGRVELPAELGDFAAVLLVAMDEVNTVHRLVPVQRPAPVLPAGRELVLAAPLESSRFFVEKHTARALQVEDSFEITDQASTEWRVVDSVERLLEFFRVVKPTVAEPLDAWGVAKWATLQESEKMARWSKHSCHELNLFISVKDPPFFKAAVEPFLRSKMEPTVVDYYLLGNQASLEAYLSPAKFQTLNLLERVLVLRVLSPRHAAVCQKLAKAMQASAAAASATPGFEQRRKALLDSVLNLESAKEPTEWTMAEADCEQMLVHEAMEEGWEDAYDDEMGSSRSSKARARSGGGARFHAASAPPPPGCAPKFDIGADEAKKIMSKRKELQGWTQPEGTKEYCETQYFATGKDPEQSDFRLTEFWGDLAAHAVRPEPRGGCLSPNFVFATTSVHEAAGALALLDLPLAAGSHNLVNKGGLAATFDPASPCIFVAKETAAVPMPEAGSDLGVAVRVYKAKLDETASVDPLSVAEFIAGEPYCLEVIVTNVSPKQLEPQVLVQVPQGALPLGSSSYVKAYSTSVGAFACWRIPVYFYFPRPGDFEGAPMYCSVDGKAVAMSSAVSYHVVRTPSTAQVETFADVVAAGEEAVLAFLKSSDIFAGEKGFSYSMLYPLMKKKAFFDSAVRVLRDRGIFERTCWGYGFLHGDVATCRELLAAESSIQKRLGAFFESPLISVDAADAGYLHLEYFPLFNKRAHYLGEPGTSQPILNVQLRETYENFVRTLARKCKPLDKGESLRLCYYLLCQDRVQEAKVLFDRACGSEPAAAAAAAAPSGDMALQQDYMAAYFDLFDTGGSRATVRRVAKERAQCPHLKWRERFAELATVLNEIDGAAADPAGFWASRRTGGTQEAKKAAPSLATSLQKGVVEIQATGDVELVVRLYKMELEVLFSRTPFIKPETLQDEFTFVKPLCEFRLPASTSTWEIPPEYRKVDLVVEFVAGTLRSSEVHFASTLRVMVAEQLGYLTVTTEEGRPLPATYVKVFASTSAGSSSASFFKDGYTDLRGRFDYATLSGESAASVRRFALLVASKDAGGLVREAGPPTTLY